MHGRVGRSAARSKYHAARIEQTFKKVYREDSFSALRGRCGYCGTPFTRTEATADHQQPIRNGGATSKDNIIAACRGCNLAKGSLSVGQFKNLLNDRDPPPLAHFEKFKAWMRFRIEKRVKKAERRIKRYVGMPTSP